MVETISYYNFKHTNVYALLLDATKAFDRVHYSKLFNELCKRNLSLLVTRLLLYMYTNQKLQVKLSGKISSQFGVLNGTKQGGVLSPILFAVYIDGMLERLKESGIGCYLSNSYVDGLAFADDVKMLCPTLSGIQLMYNICENYAEEYNIKFNGSKSCLLLFKSRQCKTSIKSLCVNGVVLQCVDSVMDLAHAVSSNDKDGIVTAAKASFWHIFNLFMSDFGHIYSFLKVSCSDDTAVVFMEHICGISKVMVLRLYVLLGERTATHCDIITALSGQVPLLSLSKI